MAAPSKFTTFFGMLAKLEGSYGGGGSPSTATDGVLLEEWGNVTPQFANNGDRTMAAWFAGYQRKIGATGGFVKVGAKVVMRGGQAYASTTPASSLRTLLRISGFDVALDLTPGAEKETYTPTAGPTGYASGVLSLYGHGELAPVTGALADFSVSVKGPDVPVWQFDITGLLGSVTDIALPAIAYPNFDPPKATSLGFTLFTYSPVVREFAFKWGRSISPRLDINAGGHGGFGPIRRTPQLEVTIEAAPKASFDDLLSYINATQYGASGGGTGWQLQVGSTRYNRFKLGGSFLQLMKPPEPGDDGGIATSKLTFQCNPDAIGSTNDITITLD